MNDTTQQNRSRPESPLILREFLTGLGATRRDFEAHADTLPAAVTVPSENGPPRKAYDLDALTSWAYGCTNDLNEAQLRVLYALNSRRRGGSSTASATANMQAEQADSLKRLAPTLRWPLYVAGLGRCRIVTEEDGTTRLEFKTPKTCSQRESILRTYVACTAPSQNTAGEK
jgi:hypothetical protein